MMPRTMWDKEMREKWPPGYTPLSTSFFLMLCQVTKKLSILLIFFLGRVGFGMTGCEKMTQYMNLPLLQFLIKLHDEPRCNFCVFLCLMEQRKNRTCVYPE